MAAEQRGDFVKLVTTVRWTAGQRAWWRQHQLKSDRLDLEFWSTWSPFSDQWSRYWRCSNRCFPRTSVADVENNCFYRFHLHPRSKLSVNCLSHWIHPFIYPNSRSRFVDHFHPALCPHFRNDNHHLLWHCFCSHNTFNALSGEWLRGIWTRNQWCVVLFHFIRFHRLVCTCHQRLTLPRDSGTVLKQERSSQLTLRGRGGHTQSTARFGRNIARNMNSKSMVRHGIPLHSVHRR